MTKHTQGKALLTTCLVILIAVVGYYILTAPDRRSGMDKISDAISALPSGTDKAARQLEDRTPAQKLDDAAKDTGNDIKKATNQQ